MSETWVALMFTAVCWLSAEFVLRAIDAIPTASACVRCRHDLCGIAGSRCPECGAANARRERGFWRRRRLFRRFVASLIFVVGCLGLIGPVLFASPALVEFRSTVVVGNSDLHASAYAAEWSWAAGLQLRELNAPSPRSLDFSLKNEEMSLVWDDGRWIEPRTHKPALAEEIARQLGCPQQVAAIEQILSIVWEGGQPKPRQFATQGEAAGPRLTPSPLEVRDLSSPVIFKGMLAVVAVVAILLGAMSFQAEPRDR